MGKMTTEKEILKIIPGLMSLAVAGEALKLIPKKKAKITKPKKIVKGFANIIIGTALINPTASVIDTI